MEWKLRYKERMVSWFLFCFVYFRILCNDEYNLGKIHGAIVMTISYETKTVTVEWAEGEEVKGKEVCLLL
mgnify:CR=1 FL=1